MPTVDELKRERARYDEEIAGIKEAIKEMPRACGVRLNLKIHLSRMSTERLQLHQKIRRIEDEEGFNRKMQEIYTKLSGRTGKPPILPTPHLIGVPPPRVMVG